MSPMSRSLRRSLLSLLCLPVVALAADQPAADTAQRSRSRINPDAAPAPAQPQENPLKKIQRPPLPEGVEELDFTEFFKTPVGPRGLELTERLQSLNGRRVRILGYMVHEDTTPCNSCPIPRTTKKGYKVPSWIGVVVAGRMMLTPYPANVSHAHYGLADDLPPQTLFVEVPDRVGELVPYTPGPMLLTGVLSVGPKNESDARTSVVRLLLDLPTPNTPSPTAQN